MIDRTGLILEIFGARAKTSEGRLQVELAALTYQRSRLVRSWTHLERQRGGFGFLGGPGEAQIELDRRRIDERITRIERDLEAVKRTRGLHREAREREALPVIALVGYTNAGKSTLFNRLTGAAVERARPAVRDPRSDHAAARPAVGPAGDPVRHGGLHRRPADRSGGGVPRHAGGGPHGRAGDPRARRGACRERGAAQRRARGPGQPRPRASARRGPAGRVLEQARSARRRGREPGARGRGARRRAWSWARRAAARGSTGCWRELDRRLAVGGAGGRARARPGRWRQARLAVPPRQGAGALRERWPHPPAGWRCCRRQHGQLARDFPPDAIL